MREVAMRWWVATFYWALTGLLHVLLFLLARWRVRGRRHVPKSGPLIVVSNHLHNADPPMVGAGVGRRRIRFMAKSELFRGWVGVVMRSWGAFPVRRFESDLRALRTAERLLAEGQVIGMFPEGTRSRTGRMGKVHPGTALIALRSGAPLLPCAITGTEQFRNPLVVFRRPRFSFAIGEPIRVPQTKKPTTAEVSELTERIRSSIQALLPPPYRDAYTDDEATGTNHG